MGEVIDFGKVLLMRSLRGPTHRANLETRISELLDVLQDRNCPHIIAEILVLRDAVWRLAADDPIHHHNHGLPAHLIYRDSQKGEP